jgi:hypothetical protein
MNKTQYSKLVLGTYVFYMLLSLAWFVTSLAVGGYVNFFALVTFAAFAAQFYFKHRITNLVLGILVLPASIYGALFFLSWGGNSGFDTFISVMIALSIASIAASIILVFGYLKLSFNND